MTTLNLKRFGERIRTSRKAENRKWTLVELAARCTEKGVPVSANYLSVIERNHPHYGSGGEIHPSEPLVDMLITLLDLPNEARLEAGYPPKEFSHPNMRLALRLEPYLTVLSPVDRERVETLLEQTARQMAAICSPAA